MVNLEGDWTFFCANYQVNGLVAGGGFAMRAVRWVGSRRERGDGGSAVQCRWELTKGEKRVGSRGSEDEMR